MCTNGQKSRIKHSTLSIRRERRGVTRTLRESRLVGATVATRKWLKRVSTEILQTKDETSPLTSSSALDTHTVRGGDTTEFMGTEEETWMNCRANRTK